MTTKFIMKADYEVHYTTSEIVAKPPIQLRMLRIPGYPRDRDWIVERTHSWMKGRFRRLLGEKVDVAMLHFVCTWITFRVAGLFAYPHWLGSKYMDSYTSLIFLECFSQA
jgi:hypothetical protein